MESLLQFENSLISLTWLAVSGAILIAALYYVCHPAVRYTVDQTVVDKSEADVIVVGSGILGSALAAVLARDGRRVVIIERDLKEPDRIVGELLQPGGCRALNTLGLGDCTDNIDAHAMKGYIVHDVRKGANVHIPYPDESDGVEGGCAFHHGRFVMSLRKASQAEPNVRCIEGTVSQLLEDKCGTVIGVQYRDKKTGNIQELYGALTVVADGCFSKLRKGLVKSRPEVKSHFVGLLMDNCPQMRANHAELVLADPSPILVYQISSTKTRVLVDMRNGLPRDMRSHLVDHVAPQMPEHMREPFLEAVTSGQVRSMPNNFLAAAPVERRGVMCLGDALNMRHPLTGAGMTVAFNDVIIIRDLLRGIDDLRDYSSMLCASHTFCQRRRMNHSFTVNVLSVALYELFAANDEYLQCLKDACFCYFQLGGQCVAGPVALLSVLDPNPWLLLGHFFAVAFYAVYSVFKKQSLLLLHQSAYRSTRVFLSACNIIFPLIWSEVKTVVKL